MPSTGERWTPDATVAFIVRLAVGLALLINADDPTTIGAAQD